MFTIVAIMFSGIGVGWLFRRRQFPMLSQVITVLIWALLFCLGVEVGMNPQVIGRLGDLGIEAVVLCVGGLAGSIALAWVLWLVVQRKKKGGQP